MNRFFIGVEYTHSAITSALGGDAVSYLPQVDGRIVCARLKAGRMNPNAPYEILVAALPNVERKARLLASSGHAIPVFIKEGVNRWRYHGLMRCERFDTRTTGIKRDLHDEPNSITLAGVLRMVDVKTIDPPKLVISPTPEPVAISKFSVGAERNWAFAVGQMAAYVLIAVASVLVIAGATAAGGFVGIAALLSCAFRPRRRYGRSRSPLLS